MSEELLAVSYGGGTNSTALLVGLQERGIRPDVITFADTGGEKPHTYAHIFSMQFWLQKNGFPEITTVRKGGNGESLAEECERRGALPSIAYGFKTCSQKFKIGPQVKFFNNYQPAKEVWAGGNKITRAVGFDAESSKSASSRSGMP